jgi:hypothetical protein
VVVGLRQIRQEADVLDASDAASQSLAAVGAREPPDLGGNLDRQSDCRYRARTAVRLAAGASKPWLVLTSLCLAGRASIAGALRFHAAARIAHCQRS